MCHGRKDWVRDGYPRGRQVGSLYPWEGPSPFTIMFSRLRKSQGTGWGLLGRVEGMESSLRPSPTLGLALGVHGPGA